MKAVEKQHGENEWLTEVVIKLPNQIATTGDIWVSISLRGVPSNKVFVTLKP